MERLDRRIPEAAAALATLDELAGRSERTLVERDGAVPRHMYRDQVGRQIEGHLAAHAALLRGSLEALQRRAVAE